MRRRVTLGAAALLSAVAAGCVRSVAAPPTAPPDTITADQIVRTEASNAYEAIQRLQPNFLSSRGPISLLDPTAGLPNVYLDDVLYGPISSLTTIPVADIGMIRIYHASEATFRFGTGNAGGVIDVFTKH